jgi:hypothetical protein
MMANVNSMVGWFIPRQFCILKDGLLSGLMIHLHQGQARLISLLFNLSSTKANSSPSHAACMMCVQL